MANIIVVDDDRVLRKNLAFYLKSQGYDIDTAESGEEAIKLATEKFYDIMVADIRLTKMSGFELMKNIMRIHPATEIVLITGFGNIPMAVEAIHSGAADFICKPFEFGSLLNRVEKILQKREKKVAPTEAKYDKIITKSQKMRLVLDLVAKASMTETPILIEGDPGTGKELVARAIHHRSSRKDSPFVMLECSCQDENRLHDELFGTWDNTESAYPGVIVIANGSTLFLKDVDQVTPALQTQLLRFIQDGFFTVTGRQSPSDKNQRIKSDVRITCSTVKNLKRLVTTGHFREDLYYALNLMPIYIPPLRNRIADVFPLVNHFLEKYGQKFEKQIKAVAPEILAWMQTYQWPGNVAELENIVARACALSNSEIIDESLIFPLPRDNQTQEPVRGTLAAGPGDEAGTLVVTLRDNQKALILKTLRQNAGNYTRTAQQLGISRTTLWRRMRRFKVEETVNST